MKLDVMLGIAFLPTICVLPMKAQDSCLALIPAQGAFKVVLENGQSSSFDNARDWFCSDDFMSYAQQHDASGGVTVPIEGVPVAGSFKSNDQQQVQQRSQFCGDHTKTISQSASNYLFVKEGDPTLADDFVKCEAISHKKFLDASGKQETENVFSVELAADQYPGPEPRIVSVTAVDGASALSDGSFTPASVIPWKSVASLTGLYKYDTGRTDALVLVKTTIGDTTVKVTKCRKSAAGKWNVIGQQTLTREDPAGTYSTSFSFPQASCHPHCGRGGQDGDWQSRDIAVSSDLALRNPHWACNGGGCAFDVDQSFAQDTEQHIQFKVRVRSLADTYVITADQFRHVDYKQDQLLSSGDFTFGNTTSVTVPDGAELRVDAVWGAPVLTALRLSSGDLGTTAKWLHLTGSPGNAPAGRVYSFDVVDANCSQ